MRLDLYLVKYGYYPTRAKAQRGIEYNLIKVNDNIINKANHDIKPQDQVVKVVSDEYVSRGAYKLLTAIHHWKIDLSDKVVLDLGASTGGFSQVCIQLGAKMIYAVDVGHDQLHWSLRNHRRITNLERTHFNIIKPQMFDLTINLIVADLSFISLTKLLDHLKQTFFHPFQAIMLIKPQFELTSQLLRKYKGKINNPKLHNLTIAKIKNYALKLNYIVHGVIPSSLTGAKANNQEYLIYLKQN